MSTTISNWNSKNNQKPALSLQQYYKCQHQDQHQLITSMLVLCLFSPDSAVSPPRTTSRVELSFSRGQTCERSSKERSNKDESGGQRQRQRSEETKTRMVVATSCSEQMTVSSASPSQVPMPGSFSLVRVCQCHVAFVLLSSLWSSPSFPVLFVTINCSPHHPFSSSSVLSLCS